VSALRSVHVEVSFFLVYRRGACKHMTRQPLTIHLIRLVKWTPLIVISQGHSFVDNKNLLMAITDETRL
jgi:hypothetical protein